MGLGKTIEAIGVINADTTINSVLVICPASIKRNWERELTKWLTRPMSISIGDGSFADIIITNYEDLYERTADHNLKPLYSTQYDCLIVDECHFIKNGKSIRSKSVQAINARRKLYLTGTPIVNRPTELWTIVHTLDPENWPSSKWRYYHKRYCDLTYTKWGTDVRGANKQTLPELAATSPRNHNGTPPQRRGSHRTPAEAAPDH
jgi:SNF2 family DNA or RNA helicase